MQKRFFFTVFLTLLVCYINIHIFAKEDYLRISAGVNPKRVKQGEEGVLTLKITPIGGLKIASHPKFMIKLNANDNLVLPKLFFTASELNVETTTENGTVFLDLEKESEIGFKVDESALIGKINITGEIIFTAVFRDNWSLKTHQKFSAGFYSIRNTKIKKK